MKLRWVTAMVVAAALVAPGVIRAADDRTFELHTRALVLLCLL